MIPFTLRQLCEWTGGRLVRGAPDLVVTGVSTDTRTLAPGDCFIALVGERFDGHHFLVEAAKKGAAAVVVDRERASARAALPETLGVVTVAETRAALADLARGYRLRFDVPVVAVTGSNGKTSTKEMIAAILGRLFPVVASEKNFNNEIGLPLTLFRLEPRHGAAVVEMGMRGEGEIAALARTAMPTVGVVTNVGPVHVERLGSIERVAAAKAELVEALPAGGLAVLNGDDERVRAMAARTRARVITFGFGEAADARAVDVASHGIAGSRFTFSFRAERFPVELSVPGRHQVQNAVAAAAAALSLGARPHHVQEALAGVRPGEMRLAVTRLADGVVLINDAYNASPLSVRAALDVLAEVEGARRVAVLGDMLELGALSEEAHLEVGRQAARSGVALLVAVGRYGPLLAAGAREGGLAADAIRVVADAGEAAGTVEEWISPGDVILVKGSRGVRLEQVAERIERLLGTGAGERESSRT